MLYRIVICDDDPNFREILQRRVSARLKDRGIDFSIVLYSSGEELLKELEEAEQLPHLVFLDILMGEINGIDTARKIREKDSQTSIVFITSSDQYVFLGYEVQALQYLLKPIQEEQLTEILEFDLKRRFEKQYLTFQIKLTTYHIAHDEILYLESDRKATKLFVKNRGEVYRIPMRISELENTLIKAAFCRCHRGFIVNLSHVTEINSKFLMLDHSIEIPIGRLYAASTKHSFLQYIQAV